MNKKIMFKTLFLAAFGMQLHAQDYCEPEWSGWAVNEPTRPVTLVQFGQNGVNGIDNSSSDIVSSDTPRYEDFSAISMNVVKGESYTLKVKGNTDGNNTDYITVYFDWNGDGVFSNSTPATIEEQQQWTNQKEKHQHGMSLINSTGEDDVEVSYTVNIPTDAVTGEIRMRVVKNYNAPSPAPCSNPFIFGQVEDYTLNISEGTCYPVFEYNADGEMITQVIFNTIDNTSPFQSGTTPQYEDFTDISTDVQVGSDYELSVKGPASTFPSDVVAYIDFNQDGVFDQDTEFFYVGRLAAANPANANTVTTTITIPETALNGETIMRIIKNSNVAAYSDDEAPNTIVDACAEDLRSGQVEEYTVNILNGSVQDCDNSVPGENPGDTGCVTFTYAGETVTYTTVRGADGNIWLQQNLGSESVGTSATDALAFGDLFQWGRWDDGHQSRTSDVSNALLSPNNPTALGLSNSNFYLTDPKWWSSGSLNDTWNAATPQDVSETDGCDPCKAALGEGWEVPTQSEWQTIITAEEMDDIQSAYDSNLKLVVAGARSTSGVYHDGLRGYYWSKTISETNPLFAKNLYYSDFTVNSESGYNKEQGMSVRCIYKQNQQQELSVTVTTQDNIPAEITTENGTLQLVATITPSEANQEVTWSVEEGTEFVSVDENGLVTAIANGTATVRATSVEDETKYGEIEVVVNISEEPVDPDCEVIETFDVTFDDFENFPANCWSSNDSSEHTFTVIEEDSNKMLQVYSGFAEEEVYIISPEMVSIDGAHSVSYEVVSITQPGTTLQIGTMSDPSDVNTFVAAEDAVDTAAGVYTSQVVPAVEGHKYVAIKYVHNGGHKVLKLDNIKWIVPASSGKFDRSQVTLYPNPTRNLIYIDTDLNLQTIDVYNNLGQRILTANGADNSVDLSAQPAGVYIFRLQTVDGQNAEYKVIKQ